MRLGIDAANLRAGGGVTHLREILQVLDPDQYDIDKIIIITVTHLTSAIAH